MQIWPWCRNEPQAPADAAPGTSASSSTISAELPPSSRCTRLRCWAASAPTCRPTAVEPVNEMIRTTGSVISASPASGPPGSTCSSPSGRPASSNTRASTTPPHDRGPRVRLQHHRVAQRQRGRDRADGQDLREVERRDHPDHAGRHPLGPAQVGRLGTAAARRRAATAGWPPRRSPRWPRASRTARPGRSSRSRGCSTARSRPRAPARCRRPGAGWPIARCAASRPSRAGPPRRPRPPPKRLPGRRCRCGRARFQWPAR